MMKMSRNVQKKSKTLLPLHSLNSAQMLFHGSPPKFKTLTSSENAFLEKEMVYKLLITPDSVTKNIESAEVKLPTSLLNTRLVSQFLV